MKILLAYRAINEIDGIKDHSRKLVSQLRADGHDAAWVNPRRGLLLVRDLLRQMSADEDAALVVQYNPFAWGRWGFAPDLVLATIAVRLRRPRASLLIAVHELFVEMRSPPSRVMGVWQRLQLAALLRLSDGALASCERFARSLRQRWPSLSVRHLPVGSNLPDRRRARSCVHRCPSAGEALVVASFQTGHDSQLGEPVRRGLEEILAVCEGRLTVMMLGAGNQLEVDLPEHIEILRPGAVHPATLAELLARADLALMPFVDGVSTRRGTVIAALQHGIATLTTCTDATDAVLRMSGALALAPAGDAEAFAAAARELARRPLERERLGAAARDLFEREFSWPLISARVLEAVDLTRADRCRAPRGERHDALAAAADPVRIAPNSVDGSPRC